MTRYPAPLAHLQRPKPEARKLNPASQLATRAPEVADPTPAPWPSFDLHTRRLLYVLRVVPVSSNPFSSVSLTLARHSFLTWFKKISPFLPFSIVSKLILTLSKVTKVRMPNSQFNLNLIRKLGLLRVLSKCLIGNILTKLGIKFDELNKLF